MIYVYVLSPIDIGWSFLRKATDVAKQMIDGERFEEAAEFLLFFKEAKERAKRYGWEGDFKCYAEPRVISFPIHESCSFEMAIAWKQSNNGTTFVVSGVPMPWLEEF